MAERIFLRVDGLLRACTEPDDKTDVLNLSLEEKNQYSILNMLAEKN